MPCTFLVFFGFFHSADRVSPRRATGFLARARKPAKKACCAAWHHRTHFAPAALRSDNYGESDGRGHAGYRRCALMDALLLVVGGFACCAASAVVQSLLIAAAVGSY